MLATLWEWRSYIGWAIFLVAAVVIFTGLRPIIDAAVKTYTKLVLPFAEWVLSTKYGKAVLVGILFVVWTGAAIGVGAWWSGTLCDAHIVRRERDAIAKERDELAKRLDTVETITMNDRDRAARDAADRAARKDNSDAFRPRTGVCFSLDTARRLFSR